MHTYGRTTRPAIPAEASVVREHEIPITQNLDAGKEKLRFAYTKDKGLIETVLGVADEYPYWGRLRILDEVTRRLRRSIDERNVNWVLKEHKMPHLDQ
jgi:hypothetical protein